MAKSLELAKLIFVPALISLAIFVSIRYLVRPAINRYRERYEQYLPLHSVSNSLAQRTRSLKDRIGDKIMSFILPRFNIIDDDDDDDADRRGGNNEELLFADNDGENMVGFDFRDIDRRREQLRRDVGNMEGARRSAEDFGEAR